MTGAPIKVLFVAGVLTGGGAERFLSTTVRWLDRTRFIPSIALFRDEITYDLPDDVSVVVLSKTRKRDIPQTIVRLARLIDECRPDLILSVHAGLSPFLASALLLSGWDPPWIARVSQNPRVNNKGLLGFCIRRSYRRVSKFLVNSNLLAEELRRVHPVSAQRISVVYNPTDFDDLDRLASNGSELANPSGSNPVVIAAGRFTAQKRHDLLLGAFALTKREIDARLIILGDGELRGPLEAQIQSLGLQDSVILAGFRKNPYPILAQADLFALSSEYEGLPNALIEAQGLGLAAVSTDCPYGPSEIIEPGRTGLLVPIGNVEKLSAAMIELLRDPERRHAMGRAARRRARALFSTKQLIPKLSNLMETLVSQDDARHGARGHVADSHDSIGERTDG